MTISSHADYHPEHQRFSRTQRRYGGRLVRSRPPLSGGIVRGIVTLAILIAEDVRARSRIVKGS